jgi:hypothetical protein
LNWRIHSHIKNIKLKTYGFSTYCHDKLKFRFFFYIIDKQELKWEIFLSNYKHHFDCITNEVESKRCCPLFFIGNICVVWSDPGFPAVCWNSHGHKLCSLVSWSVYIFFYDNNYSKTFTWEEKYLVLASIDNACLVFGNLVFQQSIELSMDKKNAPLSADMHFFFLIKHIFKYKSVFHVKEKKILWPST